MSQSVRQIWHRTRAVSSCSQDDAAVCSAHRIWNPLNSVVRQHIFQLGPSVVLFFVLQGKRCLAQLVGWISVDDVTVAVKRNGATGEIVFGHHVIKISSAFRSQSGCHLARVSIVLVLVEQQLGWAGEVHLVIGGYVHVYVKF